MDNKPHSRSTSSRSGSAGVSRGRQVSSRPVGGGSRPSGSHNSYSSQRSSYSGSTRSAGSTLGLLGLFFALPKKLRRILVILVVVFLIFSFFRGRNDSQGVQEPVMQSPVSGIFGAASNSGGSLYNYYAAGSSFSGSSGAGTADTTVAPEARAKFYTPRSGDDVTVMIYLCGTDLESKHGMATADLAEMAKAEIGDNVNVIALTGGCKQWKNNIVSSTVNEIYQVRSGGLSRLESSFGRGAMTDPATLTEFIRYCTDNFPARRNILILWDHGGGSVSGYGYDEKQGASNSMDLAELDSALRNAGCTFDMIGFDACLMASLENALVCSNYADYLLASEETEPGTGWYYTNWLTALSQNTAIPTVTLGKQIIDDYFAACQRQSPSSKLTLALTDLAELEMTVPAPLRSFAGSMNDLLDAGDYQTISNARSGARQYAVSSKINQVDLSDLAARIGTDGGKQLCAAIDGCVKYNRSTLSGSSGLSIYFPYESLKNVNSALNAYNEIGMDSEYLKCIKSFASLEYGGQVVASSSQQTVSSGSYTNVLGSLLGGYSGSSSPLGSLLGSFGGQSAGFSLNASDIAGLLGAFSGRSMPAGYEWVDTQRISDSAETMAAVFLNPGRITATEKDGRKVLALTDEEWALIQTVELNVFVDDGEGFIDMGLDNVFTFDGNDLLLDWDGSWLTLDGQAVTYYLESDTQQSDGSWITTGRIPALLNGEPVNLRVVFEDGRDPYISGAYPLYDAGQSETQAKGEIPVQAGDTLEFLCDYYGYDGSYGASYTLGDPITLGESYDIANMALDVRGVRVSYRLTDIYGNHYWLALD